MSRLTKRTYYHVTFELLSALSIGMADSSATDNDAVLDSRGMPVIPASSFCGALRAHLDDSDKRDLFGDIVPGGGAKEGCVRVYDAVLLEGSSAALSIRDNVSLERRVARKGLKFDREVINKGARFCALIETVLDESSDQEREAYVANRIEGLIRSLDSGQIRLGAKKTRGLGRVSVVECKKRTFDLAARGCEQLMDWILFDPFDDCAWAPVGALDLGDYEDERGVSHIKLTLRLLGGISVREYTTEPESYDFGQMAIHCPGDAEGQNDVPVIPGTSWAGAIRERYMQFAPSKEMVSKLFGEVSKDVTHKSLITFDESIIEGGEWKTYTRNVIDRFTGGTLNGLLYTQRSYYGGNTTLEIGVRRGSFGLNEKTGETDDLAIGVDDLMPLISALADLHNGFMAVGGLASVGHGLFKIEEAELMVDGQDRSHEFSYALLRKCEGMSELIVPDVRAAAEAIVRPSESQEA